MGPLKKTESDQTPRRLPRREFIIKGARACAALAATPWASSLAAKQTEGAGGQTSAQKEAKRIIVVGAGAFGGWTALYLLRRGYRVTLLDSWGPGNSRASSGGESRVIRATYGPAPAYTKLAARALQLWREHQQRWQRPLYRQTGTLWMVTSADDSMERASLPILRDAGLAFDQWTTAEAARRYPQVNFDGVRWVLHEQDAGYLLARQACQAVMEAFLKEGGEYRQAAARPGTMDGGALASVLLNDRTALTADQYLFACGPWMGQIFPDVIGERLQPTRQEVYFFGAPAGDARFNDDHLPVWIDRGARIWYGIPGNQGRGFKIADDTRGQRVDPTTLDRAPSADGLAAARNFISFRFPALKNAPLLESRVCQYENSPDQNFVLDRHPRAENVWLAFGGSGHGFKHGPALGEMLSGWISGESRPDPFFSFSRLVSS